jgi:hypothetical protein
MKRFILITIEGRKYINQDLTLLSTGVYEFNCTGINFSKLYVDGAFGAIKTTPIVLGDSLYTNYYDDLNKKLQIRLNASDLTNKKNFILTHVICVTNSTDLYWNIDPDSPNTRQVIYESRLNQTPVFGQSQENNLNGLLSFSGSTIELDNKDQFFNNFFSDNDSFKSCDLIAWRCEETPATRRIVYKGTISKVDVDDVIKFSSEDFLNRLDNVLYSRTGYVNSLASSRPNVPEQQKQIKISKTYGRNSSFGYKYESITSEVNVKVLDWQKMPESYCASYEPALSTSVNRVWETGILEDMVTPMEDTYTISDAFVVGTGGGAFALVIELAGGLYDDFSVGDTIEIQSGNYAKVVDVYNNQIQVTPYTVPASAGNTIKVNRVSALVLRANGQEIYLHYKKDYTVGTPSAGNPIPITLNNNFEANYSLPNPIDPNSDQMYYKLRNKSGRASYSHGAQIKKILLTEFSASEINSTSFDDADTALNLDLCFMVPLLSDDFPNKRDLIQQLVTSSFGYLYLDDQLKISYGNFKLPSAVDGVSDVEIKKGSISHSVDYNDVYQSVSFTSTEFDEVLTMESDQATYLHKTNKQKDYPHLCDVVSIVKPIAHFKSITQILTMKRLLSQITVLEYSVRIGDERLITSSKKLGNSDCVVLSLDESDKENALRLTQLENAKGNIKLILNGNSQGNI